MAVPDGFTDDTLDLRFIGNATVLLRYGPVTLLTDPNFLHRGEYAHLGYGLLSRRLTEPALAPEDLPLLDGIVLSHLHGDHWDRRARRSLDRTVPVLSTPHAARRLKVLHGFRRTAGLRTWQALTLERGGVRATVTALPGRHAGDPVLRGLLPPVMGSMIEFGAVGGPVRLRLYVSGDTLLYDGLEEIGRRFPAADLAVLHLGGTRLPGGFLVTMNGAQGAELVRRLRPHAVLPVHYEDYTVMRSPLSAFLAEAGRLGLADRIVPCPHGGRVCLPAGPGATPMVH
ncbi:MULTISPECIES: MBL fold metallo-hydrolase [Streptomyces]|uniref:MBL fold metallo-hydrolase n=1 Tax=Streptomyces eurythermus TaxID=42237 RepID=A0ABW6Z5F7_9ACTN|nr:MULTISPECIES: MBL fold metallo-hydrolase [Streptomyces]QIS75209.1 MBL fold metallo-hydrolase [Streptomyces sp. DSM 40868]WDM15224.1 MBL fold metallo-hydrolase [Streptomyces lavenduligriseus]